MDCSACLSCGMVVLLVMTGYRLFHIFMVLVASVVVLVVFLCIRICHQLRHSPSIFTPIMWSVYYKWHEQSLYHQLSGGYTLIHI